MKQTTWNKWFVSSVMIFFVILGYFCYPSRTHRELIIGEVALTIWIVNTIACMLVGFGNPKENKH